MDGLLEERNVSYYTCVAVRILAWVSVGGVGGCEWVDGEARVGEWGEGGLSGGGLRAGSVWLSS